MDGPRDYHTKWNKSDREWQISHEITYMLNQKSSSNEFLQNRNRLIDIESKFMVTKGKMRGRINYKNELNRYKLIYT